MAVRLPALRSGRPLPPGRFMVLISVRGWVDLRAIMRLDGLGQLENPMTSGIEPATFRFVVPQPSMLLRATTLFQNLFKISSNYFWIFLKYILLFSLAFDGFSDMYAVLLWCRAGVFCLKPIFCRAWYSVISLDGGRLLSAMFSVYTQRCADSIQPWFGLRKLDRLIYSASHLIAE
jgi:hypothetical protein